MLVMLFTYSTWFRFVLTSVARIIYGKRWFALQVYSRDSWRCGFEQAPICSSSDLEFKRLALGVGVTLCCTLVRISDFRCSPKLVLKRSNQSPFRCHGISRNDIATGRIAVGFQRASISRIEFFFGGVPSVFTRVCPFYPTAFLITVTTTCKCGGTHSNSNATGKQIKIKQTKSQTKSE